MRRIFLSFLLPFALLATPISDHLPHFPLVEQKPLVVVIASYNNESICKKNLESVFKQKYRNYRVIYIDDCSTDRTYEIVQKYIEECGQKDRVTLIRNEKRRLKTPNIYTAYHSCKNHEIIICLDGDDWLAHDEVLSKINRHYQNPDVWITHGSSLVYPKMDEKVGVSLANIDSRSFRSRTAFEVSMLRTFYAGLFKQIALKDFFYHDTMMANAEDAMIMFSLIEMAPSHVQFVPEILYIINDHNPHRNYKIVSKLENFHFERIQKMSPYPQCPTSFSPLAEPSYNTQVSTVLVLSNNNPSQAKLTLESLPSEFATKIVLFESSSKEIEKEYLSLKSLFPDLLIYNSNRKQKDLSYRIANLNELFCLVINDSPSLLSPTLSSLVHTLQKTKSPCCFLGLTEIPLVYEPLFDKVHVMSVKEAQRLSENKPHFPPALIRSDTLSKALLLKKKSNQNFASVLLKSALQEDDVVLFTTTL